MYYETFMYAYSICGQFLFYPACFGMSLSLHVCAHTFLDTVCLYLLVCTYVRTHVFTHITRLHICICSYSAIQNLTLLPLCARVCVRTSVYSCARAFWFMPISNGQNIFHHLLCSLHLYWFYTQRQLSVLSHFSLADVIILYPCINIVCYFLSRIFHLVLCTHALIQDDLAPITAKLFYIPFDACLSEFLWHIDA